MAVATSNLLFFHIPRTGGTWITSALHAGLGMETSHYGHQHITPSQLDAPCLHDHYRFTVIREPASWLRSMWHTGLLRHAPDCHPHHLPAEVVIPELRKDSWEAFVDDYLRRREPFVSRAFGIYTNGCSFVGRTEDLEGALMHVLGISVRIFAGVPVNRTPENVVGDRRAEYEEGQAEAIREIEETEIHELATV